ncbi:hypothetical protein QVD17_30562 [Tagetes erecta]|uniref:Uncharacterized protein n=1 Tax=Tagetes erecta TaxID=13708 RepID=A0AAD8K3V6_TARER|nr:hypothetical protein QVD17_30562 [Tagetes erecta]
MSTSPENNPAIVGSENITVTVVEHRGPGFQTIEPGHAFIDALNAFPDEGDDTSFSLDNAYTEPFTFPKSPIVPEERCTIHAEQNSVSIPLGSLESEYTTMPDSFDAPPPITIDALIPEIAQQPITPNQGTVINIGDDIEATKLVVECLGKNLSGFDERIKQAIIGDSVQASDQ